MSQVSAVDADVELVCATHMKKSTVGKNWQFTVVHQIHNGQPPDDDDLDAADVDALPALEDKRENHE